VFRADPTIVGDPDEIGRVNRSCGVDPVPSDAAALSMGERYDHELTVWAYANNRPTIAYPAPTTAGARGPASAEARTNPPAPASAEARWPALRTPLTDPPYHRGQWVVIDDNGNVISTPDDVDAFAT
jgi:hypothetical protein